MQFHTKGEEKKPTKYPLPNLLTHSPQICAGNRSGPSRPRTRRRVAFCSQHADTACLRHPPYLRSVSNLELYRGRCKDGDIEVTSSMFWLWVVFKTWRPSLCKVPTQQCQKVHGSGRKSTKSRRRSLRSNGKSRRKYYEQREETSKKTTALHAQTSDAGPHSWQNTATK